MAGRSADVAGVEVAVDQCVRYSARLEVCESLWQSFDEGIQSAPAVLVQLVAVAIDHRVDPRQGGLCSLVEESESFGSGTRPVQEAWRSMSMRAITCSSSPRASYWSWPGTSASSTR